MGVTESAGLCACACARVGVGMRMRVKAKGQWEYDCDFEWVAVFQSIEPSIHTLLPAVGAADLYRAGSMMVQVDRAGMAE